MRYHYVAGDLLNYKTIATRATKRIVEGTVKFMRACS